MIRALWVELRKLYSRWVTVSPFAVLAATLALVAWNVSRMGAPFGARPKASIVLFFPLLMWWLPAAFVVVTGAGQLGGEYESGTLRTVLLTPVSKGRLLLAKFLACAIHAIALVAWTGGIACLLRWAFFGEEGMPLLAGTEGLRELFFWDYRAVGDLHGRQAALKILACYGYQALFLCATTALALFMSALMRRTVGALSLTVAVVAFMWVGSLVEPLAPLRPYLLVDAARGWVWVGAGMPPLERIHAGLACMAAYVLVCLVGAWLCLEGRDAGA